MTQAEFSGLAKGLPLQPGIYKYFDADRKLIYVGKAKSIRKRVSSYFSKQFTGYKTAELIRRIRHIEFTIVSHERDALLLENSLIKEHQPLFNINLKDDKSYPFIIIKNEPFPRVFFTRRRLNDGSEYYGPYTSVGKVRELLYLIKENIPLRSCSLNLTESNIAKGKFKVCLEYHLGNCKGPCEGFISRIEYDENLQQIRDLLKGNVSKVIAFFREKVKSHVEQLEFEKAAFYQSKIQQLDLYSMRSSVVNTKTGTIDVFNIIEDGMDAYVCYLAVNDGSIFQTKVVHLRKKLEETPAEILSFAVNNLRQTFESTATEIVIPFEIESFDENILHTVPKAGDKKRLLDIAAKNVDHYREDLKKKKMLHLEQKSSTEVNKVLTAMKSDLHLPLVPENIECFDNSNFHGSFPVAAMVSFKDGIPSKADYRKFNIKTVEGINDFASMKEIVHRRYSRLLKEEKPLPQLIIIDGGKGQLSAAMEAVNELQLPPTTTVIGLAKNVEEIFFPGDKESIRLPWDSESLKLIRRIRDEVHRFGITFHRDQRSKGTFKNELEGITGIGKQTVDILLKHFRSVKKVKEASEDELKQVIGPSKTGILLKAFQAAGSP